MAKQLLYTDDARKKLLAGAEKLAHAVGITLGPTGRNVIIDKSFGGPTVTKDGVTVSKEIDLQDPFENMGAKLVNAVAQKTSDTAGDGTTTATILALAIYQEGLRNITAGANPMAVQRGINKAVDAVVKNLSDRLTKRLTSKEEMQQVAAISANNDPVIGKLMADAFEKVGKDGVITVEEGKTSETTLEFVEGMQFDKGYISPYFAVNNPDLKCEFEDAYILIYEKKISNVRDMLPLLQKVAQTGRPLLIIAEDVESEALAVLVVNRLQAGLQVCAVKAPGFGDRRKAMLGDIATLTGGTFVSEDLGIKLENVTVEQLGRAKRVVIDNDRTIIVGGEGDKKKIEERIKRIRTQMDQTESEYDKEKFSERLAKLTGGVAIIRVGAATEAEMKQTKGRVEDALHATRAAVAEGIVPGGGVAYLRCIRTAEDVAETLAGDERLGALAVARSLVKPLHAIAENAGLDGSDVVDEVLRRSAFDANVGFDARTGGYVDAFRVGIVDAALVLRTALQNASSIAGLLLTSEDFGHRFVDAPSDVADAGGTATATATVVRTAPARVEPVRVAAPEGALGEVIAAGDGFALCWLVAAGGSQVKVRIPRDQLGAVAARPGERFLLRPGASAEPLAPAEPGAPDPDDLREFERLSREFHEDLRGRR